MEFEGIGIDIVEIRRIEKLLRNRRFLQRVFTPAELEYCLARSNPAPSLAAMFAAKEAVGKALGSGVGVGRLRWKDVEVLEGKSGPQIKLNGRASEIFTRMRILLSLTHTAEISGAVVLLRCLLSEIEQFRK